MGKKTRKVVVTSTLNKSEEEFKEVFWNIVKENLEKKYGRTEIKKNCRKTE